MECGITAGIVDRMLLLNVKAQAEETKEGRLDFANIFHPSLAANL